MTSVGPQRPRAEKTRPYAERPYINFGELVCRRVRVSTSWLLASWTVGELDCRRVGLSATWLSASWFVGELSSYHSTYKAATVQSAPKCCEKFEPRNKQNMKKTLSRTLTQQLQIAISNSNTMNTMDGSQITPD